MICTLLEAPSALLEGAEGEGPSRGQALQLQHALVLLPANRKGGLVSLGTLIRAVRLGMLLALYSRIRQTMEGTHQFQSGLFQTVDLGCG